jgi:hypothetical protein
VPTNVEEAVPDPNVSKPENFLPDLDQQLLFPIEGLGQMFRNPACGERWRRRKPWA